MRTEKQDYVEPQLWLIEVTVEKGFAASDDEMQSNQLHGFNVEEW